MPRKGKEENFTMQKENRTKRGKFRKSMDNDNILKEVCYKS